MDHGHSFDCRCPHGGFSQSIFDAAKLQLGRRSFLVGSAAASIAAFLPWQRARAADEVTVLKAARLFDGHKMQTPGVLVMKGDRIVSMTAGDAGSDAHVVDLGDVTLMPGLIDCHTHVAPFMVASHYLVQPGRTSDNVGEAAIMGTRNAQAMLKNGFTTLRDVGGGWGIDLAVRDAISDGYVWGPRILCAGPSLSITGGHGDSNDLPDYVQMDQSLMESGVSYGPYGFRQKVREHVKRHVDVIKILATGGVLSYGDVWDVPQLNLDEIQAIVDESTKFGRKVAAHCHGDKGISVAVEGGVHSIEHCTGVGEETLKKMEQRGTHLVPTIWALDSILVPGNPNRIPPGSVQKAQNAAKLRNEGMQRALASSVVIAYGTDAGVFPHHENNRDFALLQKMGMHPIDLLKSATSTAAGLLGTSDRGALAPGKLADVVAFSGDASRDISALEKGPAAVYLGGKRVAS